MPALHLSHKLFSAFAPIVGVVLPLAGWSLFTARRLTAENRAIIQRALPAVRLEVALVEGVAALRRVEARHAVLRDPAYLQLFVERAQAIEGYLARPRCTSTGCYVSIRRAGTLLTPAPCGPRPEPTSRGRPSPIA